jgi:hypothetical protein
MRISVESLYKGGEASAKKMKKWIFIQGRER